MSFVYIYRNRTLYYSNTFKLSAEHFQTIWCARIFKCLVYTSDTSNVLLR